MSKGENVSIVREPHNPTDSYSFAVINMLQVQVYIILVKVIKYF